MIIKNADQVDWAAFEAEHLPYGNRALYTKNGTPQAMIDKARMALARFIMRKLKTMHGLDLKEAELLTACFARILPDERLAKYLAPTNTLVETEEFFNSPVFEAIAIEAITLAFQLNAVFSAGIDD